MQINMSKLLSYKMLEVLDKTSTKNKFIKLELRRRVIYVKKKFKSHLSNVQNHF